MRDWLDDNLNERMQGLGNNLDLDAAWADLEAKRSQKPRRKSPLFWWILAGGFSTGLVAGEWHPYAAPEAIAIEQEQATPTVPEKPTASNPIGFDCTETSNSKTSSTPFADLRPANQAANQERMTKSGIANAQHLDQQNMVLGNSPLPKLTVPILAIPINSVLKQSKVSPVTALVLMSRLEALPSHSPDLLSAADQLEAVGPPRPQGISPWSVMVRGEYGLLSQSGLADAKPVDVFGGSIQARYTIKPWLWLESGFTFQQMNSQISLQQELVEFQTLDNEVIAYLQYADGTIEEQRGEVTATVTTFESFDGWQKHRLYSIPLQVGLGWPLPTKTTLGVYLGGSYGVFMNHAGYGIGSESNPKVPLEDLDLRNNHLLQWQSSLFAEQALGNSWSLQIAIGRQQAIGDWGQGFQPQSWNARLGIIRRLSR